MAAWGSKIYHLAKGSEIYQLAYPLPPQIRPSPHIPRKLKSGTGATLALACAFTFAFFACVLASLISRTAARFLQRLTIKPEFEKGGEAFRDSIRRRSTVYLEAFWPSTLCVLDIYIFRIMRRMRRLGDTIPAARLNFRRQRCELSRPSRVSRENEIRRRAPTILILQKIAKCPPKNFVNLLTSRGHVVAAKGTSPALSPLLPSPEVRAGFGCQANEIFASARKRDRRSASPQRKVSWGMSGGAKGQKFPSA